ncbi:MAG: peptidase M23 [Clostridiales bacterium]|nr:peptidase M23 [Clostridiales bacterium]
MLLVCALALGCLPRAQAASRSAIESLQSQQASLTVQKAELQKKLDGIRSSQGQALNKKNLVEQQLNVLKQQIQVSENLLAQYARQITEKEAELEQAKAKEAEYQAEFEQRVRAMEERGNVSYWSVLFQASDFSDLLDWIDMIGEIMDADDQVLDQLAEARQAVVQAKADLEASRQGQQETLAQQQSQQAQLQAQQAEVDQLIQEIATQGDVYAKQIEKLEATQDDVAQQIAEAEAIYQKQLAAEKAAAEKAAAEKAAAEKAAAEQAAKAAQAAAQKAAQQQKQQSSGSSASGSSSSSGSQSSQTTASASGFFWPIASSHRVTSPFGWRTHPITGRRNLHGGIDIAAPNGTPIMASKAGVVVISQYGSSYGNYVVISHPDGTRTLYAHMSQRNVSAGDTVRQGQTVGLVGSTGSSTGNHLHFETWTGSSSSSRVNPMQFF